MLNLLVLTSLTYNDKLCIHFPHPFTSEIWTGQLQGLGIGNVEQGLKKLICSEIECTDE